jgi:hypothetical protein
MRGEPDVQLMQSKQFIAAAMIAGVVAPSEQFETVLNQGA